MSPPIGAARISTFSNIGDEIPDSVVSRPNDNNSTTFNIKFGIRIESTEDWPEIGATISSNSADFTRAYLQETDGTVIQDVDVSALVAGDSFTFDNGIMSNVEYDIVLDAEGADWTSGYYDSPSFPYTSSDGVLTIKNGISGESTNPNTHAIVSVGNIAIA